MSVKGLFRGIFTAMLCGYLAALAYVVYDNDPLRRLERRSREVETWELFRDTKPATNHWYDTQRRLEVAMERLGVVLSKRSAEEGDAGSITYREIGCEVNAPEYCRTRVMFLDKSLQYDAKVMVMAHELAHLFQPDECVNSPIRGCGEVFAEGVAYLVTQPDYDNLEAFATYLGGHKQSLGVLRTYRREIQEAARFLRSGR